MFRPLVSRSFVLLFALVLTPALGHAAPQELINGRSQQLEGSIGFTFWVKQGQMLSNTPGEYLVLDGAAQQNLLKGAVIVAPPGFKVQQVELTIREEETSSSSRIGRTEYTSKYKQHVIRGKWMVTAPADCEPGQYQIRIRFPMVAVTRDANKAISPGGDAEIVLDVQTFRSAAERAGQQLVPNLARGVPCLLGMTAFVATIGFCIWALFYAGSFHAILLAVMLSFGAYGCALGYFGFVGASLRDLWETQPAWCVGLAAAINAVYFGLLWLLGGRGRWSGAWPLCLGIGVLFFGVLSVAPWVLPTTVPYVAQARELFPYAVPAFLPGLALAMLMALCRSRPPEPSPAALPSGEVGS